MDRRDFLTTCSTLAVASAIGATPLAASTKMRYETLLFVRGKYHAWHSTKAEDIRPGEIIRDRNAVNPDQAYKVLDPAEAWDLFDVKKTGLVLLPVGRDGKTIACKEYTLKTEVEVLVADIGGLVYEPIEMHELAMNDIVRFPWDIEHLGEYKLVMDPTWMGGTHPKTDVRISYVKFPPGRERWSRRVTKRVQEAWKRGEKAVSNDIFKP